MPPKTACRARGGVLYTQLAKFAALAVQGGVEPQTENCERRTAKTLITGRYRSGQTGQTVNLLAHAFAGSNPALPILRHLASSAASYGKPYFTEGKRATRLSLAKYALRSSANRAQEGYTAIPRVHRRLWIPMDLTKNAITSPIFALADIYNLNIYCIALPGRHAFRLHHRLGLLPRPVLCGAHREHSPAAWSSQPRPRTLNRPVQTMAITNRDLLHQLGPCRRFRAVPENWLWYRFSSKAVSLTSFQAPCPTPSVAALRKERTARIRIAPDEFPPKCR
jgi:hypothetical protein